MRFLGVCWSLMYFAYALSAQERCASSFYSAMQMAAGKYTPMAIPPMADAGRIAQTERVIPVVFHVVHRSAEENLSDRQLLSQIEVINRDFAASNLDTALIPEVFKPLIGVMGLRFALARTDPQGMPTTGIRRIPTSVPVFSVSLDDVKRSSSGGADAWPASQYLNVWVCNVQSPFLGYASFPGMDTLVDGIVLDYTVCGKVGNLAEAFNQGRTLTHELGHYLNLYHIWADEDNCTASDSVPDTPVQRVASFGCASHPKVSCSNGGDMFMNFMDYSDDRCLLMFTAGQRARAIAALLAFRPSLGLQSRHLPPTTPGVSVQLEYLSIQDRNACTHPSAALTVFNSGTDTIHSITLQLQNAGCSVSLTKAIGIVPASFASVGIQPEEVGCSAGFLELLLTEVNGIAFPMGFRAQIQSYRADTTHLPASVQWNVDTPLVGWEPVDYDTLDPLTWSFHGRSSNGQAGRALALRMAEAPFQTRGQREVLFTPVFKIASKAAYSVQMDAALLALPSTQTDSIILSLSDDCGRRFTPFATLTTATLSKRRVSEGGLRQSPGAPDWQRLEVPMPSLDSGSTVRVSLEVHNAGVSQLYLDNFFIGPRRVSLPELSFSVYPNPAGNQLEIESNLSIQEPIQIRLFSITGSLISEWQGVSLSKETMRTTLPLPPSPKALQILEIRTADDRRTIFKVARD